MLLITLVSHWLLLERSFRKIDFPLSCNCFWVECGLFNRLVVFWDGLIENTVRTFVTRSSLPLTKSFVVAAASLTLTVARAWSIIAPLPATTLDDAISMATYSCDSLSVSRIQINVLIRELNTNCRPFPFSIRKILLR